VASIVSGPQGHGAEAKLLVEGLLPGEPQRAKMVRQRSFPYSLVVAGLSGALEDGRAYFKPDEEKVLSFIASDGPPDLDYKSRLTIALQKANSSLDAYLALAVWPFLMQACLVRECVPGHKATMIDIVRADTERTKLDINLSHFEEVDNADLEDVANSLPPHLVELTMSFGGCLGLTNAGLEGLQGMLSDSLQKLHISFMGCEEISDNGVEIIAEELSSLPNLQDLKLDFSMCSDIDSACLKPIVKNLPSQLRACTVFLRGTLVDRDFQTELELRQASADGMASVGYFAQRLVTGHVFR